MRPIFLLNSNNSDYSDGRCIPVGRYDRTPTAMGIGNSLGRGALGVRLDCVAEPSEDNPSRAQNAAKSALATPILKPGVR